MQSSVNYQLFFAKCVETMQSRSIHYDDPEVNFDRIARAWSIFLKREISSYEVAIMMVHLKLARLANGVHLDSIEDAASYLAIAESFAQSEIDQEEEKFGKIKL
jgi:Domain of unknown function (DUF6378)